LFYKYRNFVINSSIKDKKIKTENKDKNELENELSNPSKDDHVGNICEI
jgi:hypothetical protein